MSLNELVASTGISIEVCSTIADARNQIKSNNDINVVVLDLLLPDGIGLKLCDYLEKVNPKIPVIINTAYFLSDCDSKLAYSKPNVKDVFFKPTSSEDILESIAYNLN